MNGSNSASRYRSKDEAVILQIIKTREYLFVGADCKSSLMSHLEVSSSGFMVCFAVAARYATSLVVLSMVSQSKISVGTRDFACFALHSRTPRPDPPPPTHRSSRDPERGKHQHSLLSNYDTARRCGAVFSTHLRAACSAITSDNPSTYSPSPHHALVSVCCIYNPKRE